MAKTIRLKSRVKPSYKYNIDQQIGLLSFKKNLINELIEHLAKYGITRSEFYRDRAIPFGSEKSISADRLMIYAKVFDCTTEELVNHEINARSIREVMDGKKIKSSLK